MWCKNHISWVLILPCLPYPTAVEVLGPFQTERGLRNITTKSTPLASPVPLEISRLTYAAAMLQKRMISQMYHQSERNPHVCILQRYSGKQPRGIDDRPYLTGQYTKGCFNLDIISSSLAYRPPSLDGERGLDKLGRAAVAMTRLSHHSQGPLPGGLFT